MPNSQEYMDILAERASKPTQKRTKRSENIPKSAANSDPKLVTKKSKKTAINNLDPEPSTKADNQRDKKASTKPNQQATTKKPNKTGKLLGEVLAMK